MGHPLEHEQAMRRALELAARGPAGDKNPRVGCVILSPDGRIVAEGWHRGIGTPHAETDALQHLPTAWSNRTGELTAVVTLEPCNHTGNTGPCSEALIRSGIGAVVYALNDPGAQSGGGAARLTAAGVRVTSGVLAHEAEDFLRDWLTGSPHTAREHRPWVTAKWAQTLDGRGAADDGSSQWITGDAARADVHARRAKADAILVGTGTLIADNPSLTARNASGGLLVPAAQQPVPVVLGSRPIPEHAAIRRHPALEAHGLTEPIQLTGDDLRGDLTSLLDSDITSVFVEGGPAVITSLLAANLVDDVLVYLAPALLGGSRVAIGDIGRSTINDILRLENVTTTQLGRDTLVHGTVPQGRPVAQAMSDDSHRQLSADTMAKG